MHKSTAVQCMLGNDPPDSTKEQIASLLCTSQEQIALKFQPVQRQKRSNDCGLFALAFVTTSCSGASPK